MASSKHIQEPANPSVSETRGVVNEDIDLFLLIERTLIFLNRYKWLFIGAALIGAFAGFLFYRSLPKVYKSKMLLHSFILTNQEHIQIVDNWNDLLQKQEREELARILSCPKETFNTLLQIKAEEIQKVFSQDNPNGFTIEVTISDNRDLPKIENAITYGLENSPYIKDRISNKKASLISLIEKTRQEINRLDSTKRMMENIISGQGKSSSSLIIDGSSVNRQLIEMHEKLVHFQQDLQFASAVQVLQDFSIFHKPVGPKKFVWIGLGIVFFLSIAYVYALLRSISARMKACKLATSSTMTVL